ncbi:MAG: NAD+ synthase [Deltaproteobacteria bacterium]|jgi:NAD+ synthase (glutamine-hydrolysing)
MKIALIQTNPVIGDFALNIGNMLSWLERAKECGCELAIFPELAVSGYPPLDYLERRAFLAAHDRAVAELIDKARGIGVLCGAITRHTADTGKPLHNSAILFEDGRLLFTTQKRLLPTYDVFDETRYFEPGRESRAFTYKGLRLGITICEDIWNDPDIFPRQLYTFDPVSDLLAAGNGLDLFINIAASPFHLGKSGFRYKLLAAITRKYSLPALYVNQVGGQDSLIFDGQSLALSPDETVAACAYRFQEDLVVVDTATWQGDCRLEPAAAAGTVESAAVLNEALITGIRDYTRKCGFTKGLLGLSGGIDSAVSAALACAALNPENIWGVALPSPYSSPESTEDARQLARNLGIRFDILPITDIFQAELATLHPLFAGKKEDVTEQNIQARIRGNLLMALSNKFGHLLLSTGNKSEMAVGYTTLYGDMSGGLAVIADVPKCQVYELASFINREQEVIPARTIARPPSAELAHGQKDEDDLPPYEVLDQILHAYLEENHTVGEIVDMGFEPTIVGDVVRRIRINEYKRKQAPQGLKVTSKAFGYGRRYPTAEHFIEDLP